MGLNEGVFAIFFRKTFNKLFSSPNTKNKNVSVRKRVLDRLLHGQMKLDLRTNQTWKKHSNLGKQNFLGWPISANSCLIFNHGKVLKVPNEQNKKKTVSKGQQLH